MKKIITTLLIIAGTLSLSSCGSGKEEAKQPEPSEITAAVVAAVEFPSPVEKVTDDVGDYYDVSGEVAAASFYICGSGAFPDEVAVLKFGDNAAAQEGRAALEKRLADQISLYETYTPDEMYKLNSAFIEVKSNCAIYCAVADNENAKSIINSYF